MLTLERAEEIAILNNNQIKVVEELLEKARQGRLEAFSKWFPKITAETSGYAQSNVDPISKAKSSFLTQLSLTQAVFNSDIYYGTKIATLQQEHLQLLLDAALNDLLFDVRMAYYQVMLDYENLATTDEEVGLLKNLTRRMEDNFTIGTAIRYNVNQARVAVANATASFYQAKKRLRIDRDHLVKILGFDPGTVEIGFEKIAIPIYNIPEIAEKVDDVERIFGKPSYTDDIYQESFPLTQKVLMCQLFSDREIKSWENLALEYRPNLRVSRKQVEIAEENVKKRKGNYLPTLDVLVNYGGGPTPYFEFPSSKFTNQNFDASVAFNLKWLVFDGLGRARRVQQAKAEKNAQFYEYQEAIQTSFADVRRQIFEIEEGVASFVTSQGNVSLAEQTTYQALEQLDVGYLTIFDYQIAVNTLVQAKNIQNQARFDLLIAYYGLRHATGFDLEGRE